MVVSFANVRIMKESEVYHMLVSGTVLPSRREAPYHRRHEELLVADHVQRGAPTKNPESFKSPKGMVDRPLCYAPRRRRLLPLYKMEGEWDVTMMETILRKHLTRHANAAVFFSNAVIVMFIPFFASAPVYMFLYFGQHRGIQVAILSEYIDRIPGVYDVSKELGLPYDESYQGEVFERLRFCIKHHEFTRRHIEALNRHTRSSTIFIYVMALGICASMAGSYYLCPFVNYPRLITVGIACTMLFLIIAEAGQRTQDWTIATFRKFSELPWYTFNVKNQKIMLHAMMHASRPLSLGPTEGSIINRRYLIEVFRCFWALYTFLSKVRN